MTNLSPELESLFLDRRKLAAKISRLNEQARKLEQDRKALDAEIIKQARLADGGQRKLSNGKILIVNRIDVAEATITRQAYSYYQWKEASPS